MLGHVCRAWRNVLLSYPILSTHISLTRMNCVQEMVLRSGSAPIHIHTSQNMPVSLTMIELHIFILKHLPRFSSATLSLSNFLFNPSPIPELIQSGESKLDSLRLHIWHYSDEDGPEMDSMVFFPNMTFPHLRSFACVSGSLHSYKNMLHPGLRRLEISRPTRVSLDQLLAALAPLQNLEELVLQDACGGADINPLTGSNNVSAPYHAITLPRLQRLDISDYWADDGIYILQAITYPATASVRVQLSGFQSLLCDLIRSVIASKLNGEGTLGAPPALQSLSLLARANHLKMHITLWEQRLSLDEIERKRYGAENAYFQFSISYATDEEWVSTVLEEMPLSNIRTAVLAEEVVDSEPLRRAHIVAQMPVLEELGLEFECYDSVHDVSAEIQGPTGGALPDNNKPERFFPQLKVLKVHEFYHRLPSQQSRPVSEYQRLAQKLMALQETTLQEKADVPFAKVNMSVTRSSFHTMPTCCCACSSAHPMSSLSPIYEVDDSVPCCAPCRLIASSAYRVARFVTRRRR